MLMLYFSGTGNSKYIAESFGRRMAAECRSIEEKADFPALLAAHRAIGFCYPAYRSGVPRPVREFAGRFQENLRGKKLILFCTQALFSGDGALAFTDLFPEDWCEVVYAEHFRMPGNLCNVFPAWMFSARSAASRVKRAEERLAWVCRELAEGKTHLRGARGPGRSIGVLRRRALLAEEHRAAERVTVKESCTGCGVCVRNCPAGNFAIAEGRAEPGGSCMLCYRCVNRCPEKAIRVVYRRPVAKQYGGIAAENGGEAAS